MTVRSFALSMLGLALTVPAHATLSFFNAVEPATSTITNFNNAVAGIPGVVLDGLSGFVNADLSGAPAIYTDPVSGAVFRGFALSGNANGSQDALSVSGPDLQQLASGGIFEITFPSPVFAFAANLQTVFPASGGSYCIGINEPSFSTTSFCDQVIGTPNNGQTFLGLVSTVPLTNIWIGPSDAGTHSTETTEIVNFETAETPEVPTLASIGAGLILLGVVSRRRNRLAVRSR